MLVTIAIRNILLIDQADISFKSGFTVITGETGAGKSILLDAILFALGDKASSQLLRVGESEGSVTAGFDISLNSQAKKILVDLGLAAENDFLLIRRIVTKEGRSKNFINDIPVNISSIKMLAQHLVEICGQFHHHRLLDNGTHLEIIDEYANHDQLIKSTRESYHIWQQTEKELQSMQDKIVKAKQDREYLEYVVNELENAKTEAGEESRLAEKRAGFIASQKNVEALNYIANLIKTSNIENILLNITKNIAKLANPELYNKISDAFEQAFTALSEGDSQLDELLASLGDSTADIDELENRLFFIRGLARKYKIQPDELPKHLEQSIASLNLLNNDQANLDKLHSKLLESKNSYLQQASKLSESRIKAGHSFAGALCQELAKVRLEKATFEVRYTGLAENAWCAHGLEEACFMFSANPGIPMASLSKIASGGEMSRFMLAVKLVLGRLNPISTVIFDEIDTGISGATADSVGLRLSQLGKTQQVFAVTHQPQVAARATQHLLISKNYSGKETVTKISQLNEKDRREEIARMLAGESISSEARAAASKLIYHDE